MNEPSAYTDYHPRWLRRRPSTYWWLGRPAYVAFIARELSSIFIAWFVLYLLLLIHSLGQGPSSYQDFLAWSRRPWVMTLNILTLLFVAFHAFTWFNLAPKAMVVHVGRKRLPPSVISLSNYGAWVAATALVLWLLLRG